MKSEEKKYLDLHRRLNEIGGILLGVGIGIFIAKQLSNHSPVGVIQGVAVIVGLGVLIYEQKKWNKFSK